MENSHLEAEREQIEVRQCQVRGEFVLCQNFPGVVVYHLRALVLYIKKAVIQKTVFFHVPDPISATVSSKR